MDRSTDAIDALRRSSNTHAITLRENGEEVARILLSMALDIALYSIELPELLAEQLGARFVGDRNFALPKLQKRESDATRARVLDPLPLWNWFQTLVDLDRLFPQSSSANTASTSRSATILPRMLL